MRGFISKAAALFVLTCPLLSNPFQSVLETKTIKGEQLWGIFLALSIVFFMISAVLFAVGNPKKDRIAYSLIIGCVIAWILSLYLAKEKFGGILIATIILAALFAGVHFNILRSSSRMKRLSKLLDDPDLKWRLKVITLSMPGISKKAGIALLARALKNDREEVREAAAVNLIFNEYARKEIRFLREALNDPSEKVRKAVRAAYKALGGKESTPEWQAEIDRLWERKSMDKHEVLELRAAPLPGLGSKILSIAALSALTGNVNASALSVHSHLEDSSDHLQFPENCCLCGFNKAALAETVSKEVTASKLGMVLGGPIAGKQKVDLQVPICEACRSILGLAPGLEIHDYRKVEGDWRITLAFLNDKVANNFRKLNEDKLISPLSS